MNATDTAGAALRAERARADELESQLIEARELLDAIRSGDIDAVVVGGSNGDARIYTLTDADRPYRVLIEQMREGAVTLGADGVILYANKAMTELLGADARDLAGTPLHAFVSSEDRKQLDRLFKAEGKGEITFSTPDGRRVPALLAFNAIPQAEAHGQHTMCAVVTDLSEEKRRSAELTAAHSAIAAEAARREGEAALRASEAQLRIALQAGRFGAWTLDLVSGELTTSEMCRSNFGRNPDAPFSYEELRDAVHPDDRARMIGALEESIATGGDYDIEYRIITPGHEVRWVLIRAQPAYDPDDAPLDMTGVSIDITDRKRDEARKSCLVELADAIRDLQDADDLAYAAAEILGRALGVSRVGYATIDPEEETLHVARDWNAPGVESLAGSLRLRDYGSFVDSLKQGEFLSIPDVREDERTASAAAALEGRNARSFVNLPVVEQGRLRAVLYVNHAEAREWTFDDLILVKEVGERTRTAVERIRVDAALRESELRYRTLFESVESGFCVFEMLFDDEGCPVDYVFLEVNPAFEAQTGLTDAIGRRISELAPGHEQRWYDLYGEIAVTGAPLRFEDYAQALGRWYEIYAYRVGEPGQHRVAALFNDVSERKRAEAQIHELNETLEQRVAARTAERNRVWAGSRDILVTASPDGVFRDVNPAWTRILGHAPEDVVGRSFSDFVWPDDLGATAEVLETAGSGIDVDGFENRYRAQDGTPRRIAWRTAFEGDLIYGYGRDVTAEKEREAELALAQEALRQSQKMEAVGQLTGGLAHDFNNLLAGISGSLEMMQTRIRQGRIPELDKYMVGAMGSARRAAALTHRLLAFSRRQTLEPKPTDVNRLVVEMEDLIRRTVGPEVAVESVAKAGLWPTLVDPNQLENALLNLCLNARDAMPDGGKITIETGNRWLDERAARERDLTPGQYVSMCVSDNGSGMTKDVVERAFDPFFTTKPIGVGTGLGLSMIYGFARQSGGQVRIYSEIGKGTMVCIYLPRHGEMEAAATPVPEQDEAATRAKTGQSVLVIDDEPLVRMLVVDVLEDLGYMAIEAGDGPQAMKAIQSKARIDLIITDVGLPNGMNGRQVADAAREIRPGLKVLFMTGYAENAVLSHGHLDPGMQVVTKPFEVKMLARRIKDLIAE